MSTHHAEIVKVHLEKHPDADTLSIVKLFDGFSVVVRTDDWSEGQLGIYVSPDTMVPVTRPEFSFLANESKDGEFYRLRVKKLRGVHSMGLLLPAPEGAQIGEDYYEALGLKRYEAPIQNEGTGGENVSPPSRVCSDYDVEDFRRYGYVFDDPQEDVYVTEKIHGCLRFNTRISMSDGARLSIKEVQVGDLVLGVNEQGKVIPSKVTQVFQNGKTNEWLKITGTRKGIGRGNSFFSITCTPQHRFWVRNSFVPASELQVNDIVSVIRSELDISSYKEFLVDQKILSIDSFSVEGVKWDLETETHNYFANGVLVHNSNARYTYDADAERMYAGSHHHWKKEDPNVLWWKALKNHPEIETFCTNHSHLVVYAEVYGCIQDLRYGREKGEVSIAVYDIRDKYTGRWLNAREAREVGVSLPWVPTIFVGEFTSKQMLLELAEGPSSVPRADHPREGIVVKPEIEGTHYQIGRVNLKIVSNTYLEKAESKRRKGEAKKADKGERPEKPHRHRWQIVHFNTFGLNTIGVKCQCGQYGVVTAEEGEIMELWLRGEKLPYPFRSDYRRVDLWPQEDVSNDG